MAAPRKLLTLQSVGTLFKPEKPEKEKDHYPAPGLNR